MTSEQRMILRRHHAAYREMGPPDAARRAAIRIGLAIGMRQAEVGRMLGVSRRTVWNIANGHRAALTVLQSAREAIARAERALMVARGRERSAIERTQRYGYLVPGAGVDGKRNYPSPPLAQGRGLADAAGK